MRTPREIEKDAREGSPFSNGSEFEIWQDANCGTCVHDKPAREGREWDGCPLLAIVYADLTPAEWLKSQNPPSPASIYTCVEYRHENDGKDDPEPKPIPDPPGQLTLFPREGFEGVRLLKSYDTEPVREAAPKPECDHVFATTGAGEPTVCVCGYTYAEYDRDMGKRMAQAIGAPDVARQVPEAVGSR